MKERCGREWPQRSFWCSLGEIRRWKYTPKQLNNQQRGQHRRLGKAQDRLPWLGLKAVETPSTSCESCQALSALFPIAGARAANTAEKKTIATILATTKGRNPSFKFT